MVKCADCGYFGVRHRYDRNIVELEDEIRQGGPIPTPIGHSIGMYETRPLCIMGVEISVADGGIDDCLRDIQIERECEEFTERKRGFTPKEHIEMVDRAKLLKWQTNQEKYNRRYRLIELGLVVIAILAALAAAFIERGGQPTINIITPETPEITIEGQQ